MSREAWGDPPDVDWRAEAPEDKIEGYAEQLKAGRSLTLEQQVRLVAIVELAAGFTDANDRGDDASALLDQLDADDEGPEAAGALQASNAADRDYNRIKDSMFVKVRELMGWPARPARYATQQEAQPHPFAQEGDF